MGITCEQVGGLWDPEAMSYRNGAGLLSQEDKNQLGLIPGASFGGVADCGVLCLCHWYNTGTGMAKRVQ
jgi:hypothetical protein